MTTTPQPAERALAEALTGPLSDAMQRFQDATYLDEDNHRYHCGGSEAFRLAPYLAAALEASGWTLARTQEPTEGARPDEALWRAWVDHDEAGYRAALAALAAREGARSEVEGLREALDTALATLDAIAGGGSFTSHDTARELDLAMRMAESGAKAARERLAASESAPADPRVIVGPDDPDEWGRRFDVAMDEED